MTMIARLLAVAVALSIASLAVAADAVPDSADAWPGYVPGGRYFRNIDWGVALWGPPNADQQTQASTTGVLVRYAQPVTRGKPGWVVTVIAAKVKDDLAADEMLKQSATMLRQGLGNRVSDIKVKPADGGQPSPLAVGRISCLVAGERNAPESQILRQYVYLKLRPKQYLTILGETAPGGADTLTGVTDTLARSVGVFDPKEEAAQSADAAERAAKLLGELKAADWVELAGRGDPQWFKVFALPQAEIGKPGAKPAPIGWAYSLASARGAAQIDSITSTRLVQGDATVSLYRVATIALATGEEQVREWTRVAGKEGATESFITANRKGGATAQGTAAGSTTFDITDRTTGRQEKVYTARIPSQPYIPVALQDLLRRKLVDQPGKPFGGFTYVGGQVRFATMQFAGVEPLEKDGKAQAGKFLIRPATTLPPTVTWTDAAGAKALKISSSPDGWMESVPETEVPSNDRHELTKAPNWP
ncbi:MAG: hypothetical protein PHU85_15950 [Phycisphaerae bacterium]|nr:hypothetical protein [Phycisphaerae bacterium]